MNALQNIATINPIEPLIPIIQVALADIYSVVQSYGWTMLALAALVKLVFWPLNAMQFRAMARMQKLQPQIKALRARYGKDPETSQKLNAETMALYREHKVNPLAGCLPTLLQMPILIGLYYAITESQAKFTNATWLWIGSPISFHFPNIRATDLAKSDLVLLAAYLISMYFTVRFSSPASLDAQQAKRQRIMAFILPALTGYFGFRYRWPSALLIYWVGSNVFTIFQQRYMLKTPDGLNARSWSFLVWAILSCLLPALANTYIDGWLIVGWIVFTFLLFASINGAREFSLSAARLRQR